MKIHALLLLFAAIWLVGCPYYNTFYNAKKAFSEAEQIRKQMQLQQGDRLPQQAVRLYEQAIENSALILRDHPHSDLVDDALVLIGDAFLAQSQFPQAARKYEEVLTNYPESDWVPYCMFSLGNSSLSAGDTTRAEVALQDFLQAYPRNKWSPEAHLLLSSISFRQKNYEQAIERYTDFLTSYPKHKKRGEAQYYIAEAHLELDRHTEALNLFEKVSKIADTNELEFQANYMIGECLRRDQEYESALQKFNALLGKGSYLIYRPKIMLALAACQDGLNQFDESIAQYEDIMERYERDGTYSAEVSQAMFELGYIYERQGDLPRAEELYLEARRRSPNVFWVRDEADRKSQDIKELQKYREDLTKTLSALLPPDSLQIEGATDSLQTEGTVDLERLSNVTEARFQLAEHYLFRFNLVDSALVHYRLIEEETQDQNLAAKAAYARAWIIEHVVEDSVASAADYHMILAKYGHTSYGSEAARALSLPDPNGPSDDDIFKRAEALLFEAEVPDSALHLYSTVFEQYPESVYASQALFAMGWITETHQENPDSALQIYRQIDALYPRSDQAAAVSSKIRFIEELLAESGIEVGPTETDHPDEDTADSGTLSDLPIFAERHGDVIAIQKDSVLIRLRQPITLEIGKTGYLFAAAGPADGTEPKRLSSIRILSMPNPLENEMKIPTLALQGRIRTKGNSLKIRALPAGEVIGALPNETPVEIVQESGDWLQVRTRTGETGYVSRRFVKREKTMIASKTEAAPSIKNQTLIIAQMTDHLDSAFTDLALMGVLFDLGRSPGPMTGTSAAVRHGDVVTVNERQVKIKLTTSIRVEVGDTGYLYAIDAEQNLTRKLAAFQILALPDTSKIAPTRTTGQSRIRTGGNPLRLRSGPAGEVIGELPNETPVEILQEDGVWLQVRTRSGETGYVNSRFLRRVVDPEPFFTAEIVGLQSPLAMNTGMGVVFDKAVEVVPRTPVEDTPPVVQVADRRILKLDHMTRNKSQALVSSLAGYRLDVNMLLRQHVEIGDTGYVYIVEIVKGVETAYRIADMQVEDIKINTITKGIPIGSNIDFRDSPGGRIISMVSPSSSLDIISNEGEWQKARYQGREGYVFTEYVSLRTVQEEIVTCRIFNTYETIDTDGWLGIHFEDK